MGALNESMYFLLKMVAIPASYIFVYQRVRLEEKNPLCPTWAESMVGVSSFKNGDLEVSQAVGVYKVDPETIAISRVKYPL